MAIPGFIVHTEDGSNEKSLKTFMSFDICASPSNPVFTIWNSRNDIGAICVSLTPSQYLKYHMMMVQVTVGTLNRENDSLTPAFPLLRRLTADAPKPNSTAPCFGAINSFLNSIKLDASFWNKVPNYSKVFSSSGGEIRSVRVCQQKKRNMLLYNHLRQMV